MGGGAKMPLIHAVNRHFFSTDRPMCWSICQKLRIVPLLSDCLQSHCGGRHVHLEVADKNTRARNTAGYQSGVGIS